MLAALLLLQAGAWVIAPSRPTVGDTVELRRAIAAGADVRVRAQPLGASLLLEPLADPAIDRTVSGVQVRYVVALFEPGRHAVAMPAVELVHRDGRVDLTPEDTAWITVASVLPPGDSLPAPRPSLGPLPRFPTRLWPLIALCLAAVAGTASWAVARRRVRPAAAPPAPSGRPAPLPLARWVTSGEGRAVAAVAAERLRGRIARQVPEADRSLGTDECIAVLERQRPEWPVRELTEILRGLDRARFAPAVPSDVILLVERADQMVRER
jgi:hypothetical protein